MLNAPCNSVYTITNSNNTYIYHTRQADYNETSVSLKEMFFRQHFWIDGLSFDYNWCPL